MFALGAILPFVMVVLVFTIMPESPRWLVQKERFSEAKDVLKIIYGEGRIFIATDVIQLLCHPIDIH